jgi:TolB protein
MRMRRVLLALLAAASVAGIFQTARASHGATGGLIVFASDREKFNPGEIYSLAPGSAPRDVSRSLAGDYGLAVAPARDLIAFWSGRTGTDRVYLARSDGSHLRLVRATAGNLFTKTRGSGGALVFSSDGSRLAVVAYGSSLSTQAFLVETARASARPFPMCKGVARPSPDLTRMACGLNGRTTVSDLVTGRVRFTLRGIIPLWSSGGWLTSGTPLGARGQTGGAVVVDGSGAQRAVIPGSPLAWSPDGRWLLFRSGKALWEAGPDDFRDARSLLTTWSSGLLSFTPDSRYVSTYSERRGAVLLPLSGGAIVRGLDAGVGAWSRDGRLAYADFSGAYSSARDRAGAEIAVLVTDAHGHNPHLAGRFPFDDHNYSELHWLPGGERVLFLTGNSCGGSGLFAVPATGGAARPITRDARALDDPVWSPDGSRLAFSVQQYSCHMGAGLSIHIASAAADGSDVRRVTDDGDVQQGSFDRFPSYGPDGTRVVFAHGTFDSISLQIAPAAGGDRNAVPTPGADFSAAPAWSPDGKRIAYAQGRSIMAVAPRGGTPEVLARGLPAVSCGTGGLAWSPDGKRLAVGRGEGIYLITIGDPASARLAIRAKCAGNPSFSPDGAQIAFDAQPRHPLGAQSTIMVANADGSGVRTLSSVPFRQSLHPVWQPTG